MSRRKEDKEERTGGGKEARLNLHLIVVHRALRLPADLGHDSDSLNGVVPIGGLA